MERPLTPVAPHVTIRQATEADHARLSRLARSWWDERPPRIERLWFRQFPRTALVGETADGRPVALAIGFAGDPDAPRAAVYVVAVAPDIRRRGVGRGILAALETRLAAGGASAAEAVIWPGNRGAVRFLVAVGYEPIPESRATPLYGVAAIAGFDGEDEDRSILVRSFAGPAEAVSPPEVR